MIIRQCRHILLLFTYGPTRCHCGQSAVDRRLQTSEEELFVIKCVTSPMANWSTGRKVTLTRVESFSCAHRLNSPDLSIEENAKIYGKCNRINGHGHNYKVEISVTGQVDPRTGMVMSLDDLKKILNEKIMDKLDHRNIDLDVDEFREKHIPSTAENIACFIHKEVSLALPSNVTLDSVKLYETEKNIVVVT